MQNFGLCCTGWPLKECEKKDKYLDLARELKKIWNMKVTIIPIVIGTFGTVTKGLLKGLEDFEIRGRVKTIKTTALLRTARIPRRVLETWADLLSLKTQVLRNKRMSGDHPNYSISDNGQNPEKSPGDLRRLAVTQSPVKDHELTLMWKTLME